MKQIKKTDSVSLWLIFFINVALLVNISLIFSIERGQDIDDGFEELEITFLQTPECETCFDLEPFADYFSQNGVEADQIESVDYNSFEGKRLLKKYDITQVPTVIVRGDISSYDFMQGLVDSVGEMRNNDFVVTRLQPPYLDLEEDRVVGEFELVYLDDPACEECYDISEHDTVLDRLGLTPTTKKVIDANSDEGKALIDQYYIVAIPTILMVGELEPFESLDSVWGQVGTIEDDGTYILRRGVESMGTYKKLPNGEIITPVLEEELDN